MLVDKLLRSHLRATSSFTSIRGVTASYHHKSTNENKLFLVPGLIAGSAFAFYQKKKSNEKVKAKNTENIYTPDEVQKHNTLESIWVSYQGNVYDVTEFVQSHPGGATNLLLAAGKDLAPFWNIYQQHQTEMVLNILAQYKIGTLKEDPNAVQEKDTSDPYWNEPDRHPAIKINKATPFNGEPPPSLLTRSFITPNDLHFIRNRLPVPDLNAKDFEFTLELGDSIAKKYTLDDLKSKFTNIEMPITLMCAGNRRSEFNANIKEKKVNGLGWAQCAISTSRWKGILVADLLEANGLTFERAKAQGFVHLQAEGADCGPDGVGTGSSIPLERAFDRSAKVMLAFEQNGADIPRDHGYPLRFIIPGTVGARNIKWLTTLRLSHEESHSPTQRRDYKLFGPNITDPKTIPWEGTPSVQYLPVTSGILQPATNTVVEGGETVSLSGYAYSGGGNGITRVDISTDGGKNWTQTNIYNENDPYTQKSFAWTLWNYEFEVPEIEGEVEICIRATDCNCNSQPDKIDPLWNVRGLLNNSWHRIRLQVTRSNDD